MTGFPRSGRSFYLDDMDVRLGDKVLCRSSIGSPHFTAGRTYEVLIGGTLMDDTGHVTVPSARFTYA